jgi:cyclic pyranopterin phosphate synthase
LTISLDSLRGERLLALTRRDAIKRVLAGIEAAAAAGYEALKINTVVMRDFNDDELVELIEYGKSIDAEVRFIEYMDVGGATHWSQQQVVDRDEILKRLEEHYGSIVTDGAQGAAPAARFRLSDGTRFGIVASVSAPFCGSCDRSRLTADGLWYLCLYANQGYDLRSLLRRGAGREELLGYIREVWQRRDDRSAEERFGDPARGALYQVADLRADPHREMHTRGG